MKRSGWWLLPALVLAAVTPAVALEVPNPCEVSGSLMIQVHGVRSASGSLVAELYADKPEHFLKKAARLARERVPARAGLVTLCLGVPGPGSYAVAVYHDENDNQKFDRGWTGLPAEGFGVSNNPRLLLRAPTYAEAAIRVAAGRRVVSIDLRY